jgi:hypothetical protein
MASIFVVFNQSICENDDVANLTWRPIITPEPPKGTWLLQRTPHNASVTLIFNPEEPWSRSTKYVVKVPAGITSIYGETLAKDSVFEFSTPTIQFVTPCPVNNIHAPLPPSPIVIIRFDQKIDPEEVIKTVKVRVGGLLTGQLVPVYPALVNVEIGVF